VRSCAGLRRPDLPLLLLTIAIGGALGLFADDGPPPRPAAEAAADPLDDFLANSRPSLLRCLASGEDGGGGATSGGEDPELLVRRVAAQIEEIRELRFAEAVEPEFLAEAEMQERISALLEKELRPGAVAKEGEVLEVLGAVPPGTDLQQLEEDALGSQVIGLYDTRSEALLVLSSGELRAVEQITLAHELEHALADQALGIRDRPAPPSGADRELAYAAVVEGDATLAMELWTLANIGLDEQLALGSSAPGDEEFDELPDYVQRALLFPYLAGLGFVCDRYAAGGWRAVDRLYARPPASTDEVLFPERYGSGPPAPAREVGDPGAGWTSEFRRELGAAELEWLFAAPGGDPAAGLPEPRRLVAGWAGGELELWERGDERALGLALVELARSDVLCGAVGAWYRAARPQADVLLPAEPPVKLAFEEPGRAAELVCEGPEVRLGIAPDPETASRLAR